MAIDTPARIAVLGAGPIGLETALYARFLGYEVDLLEQGEVAENVRQWGHVRMFTPFSMNTSPLAIAALSAQYPDLSPPDPDHTPTGHEFVDRYLDPLSKTDLLADSTHTHTRVISICREGFLKDEAVGHKTRAKSKFQILVQRNGAAEEYLSADAVIDSTGTWNQPRRMGCSGMPAINEHRLHDRIEYQIPDVLGDEREKYANHHTLVVGNGYSAATTIVLLAEVAREAPDTKVTWVTRQSRSAPIRVIPGDSLPRRRELAETANELAQADGVVHHIMGSEAKSLQLDEDQRLHVQLVGDNESIQVVDQIVANVGFKPNLEMLSELQLQQCYASEGPMKLASLLLSSSSADCMNQPKTRAESLLTTEVRFYILGSKSYARNSQFLLMSGLTQIRELFTVISGREDLNLYDRMKHLSG